MGDDAKAINPTKLEPEQAILLRQMLEYAFDNESTRVWHNESIYTVIESDRGMSTQKKIILTHEIIHQQHFNVVTGEVENRYAVYSLDDLPINGNFASVYNVLGELVPARDGGLIFKPKSRKVKVQQYIYDPKNKIQLEDGDNILIKEDVIHESDMSQIATHLHAATATFEESKDNIEGIREGISYITIKKFVQKTLWEMLKKGDEIDIKSRLELSCQLLYALKYQFHIKKIVHRDIKPENIIVNDAFQVNIIDMGFSKKSDEDMHNSCGTADYACPEVYVGAHSFKSDIYALGIILGLLWGGTIKKELMAPKISIAVIANLFRDFANSLTIDSASKEKIKNMIERMTSHNPNHRPDISEAVLVFDEILLSLRCQEIPDEFRQSFVNTHGCAQAVRDKMLSETGSFERIYVKMKTELKSTPGGIYAFRDDIKFETTSFDSICDELKTALKSIAENPYSVNEFKHMIQIKCFNGQRSKNEMIAIVDYTANEYREVMVRIEALVLQAELTTHALSSGSVEYPNYVADVKAQNYKLKKCWYKLMKHRADFDKVREILANFKTEIVAIEPLLENITSFIADERATQQVLRKRLAITTNEHQTPLSSIKNAIRVSIKEYHEKSVEISSLTVFRQVSYKQRFRDINDILDVVDYATTEDQLRQMLITRLNNVPTGFAGRSELRKAVKSAINLELAVSRSVTASPAIHSYM